MNSQEFGTDVFIFAKLLMNTLIKNLLRKSQCKKMKPNERN